MLITGKNKMEARDNSNILKIDNLIIDSSNYYADHSNQNTNYHP